MMRGGHLSLTTTTRMMMNLTYQILVVLFFPQRLPPRALVARWVNLPRQHGRPIPHNSEDQIAHDEEVIAIQPDATRPVSVRFDELLHCISANGEAEITRQVRNGEFSDDTAKSLNRRIPDGDFSIGEAMILDQSAGFISEDVRRVLLTVKTLRRILNSKESIFKYGVFVPRSDTEADASPEHLQWTSGRTLE